MFSGIECYNSKRLEIITRVVLVGYQKGKIIPRSFFKAQNRLVLFQFWCIEGNSGEVVDSGKLGQVLKPRDSG